MRRSTRFPSLATIFIAVLMAACDADPVIEPVRFAVEPTASVAPSVASSAPASTLPTVCSAGATRWIAAVNGSWTDPARWSAGVPTTTVPACIDLPGLYVITLQAQFATTVWPAQGLFLGVPGASAQPVLRITQGTLSVGTDVTTHGRIELSPGVGAALSATGTVGVAPTGTLAGANTGGKTIEAAVIENQGTISTGSGLVLRAPTTVNYGSISVPLNQTLHLRGPTAGGTTTVTLEGGSVAVSGTLTQTDGTMIVRGGTVTGIIGLLAVDELRLEHDGGGRFNLNPLPGAVPSTTSRLSGIIGPGQHVWMGLNHLTVVASALVNRGLLTVHHVGAFQKTGTVLHTEPGTILTNEGTLILQSSPNSGPVLAGAITNAAGGLIANASDHATIIPTPLINQGTLRATTQSLFIRPDGATPADVRLEGGTVESTTGRYQQNGGTLTVSGGTVAGQLDLIAVSELHLDHDGGGRFNLLPLAGAVPATTSGLSGIVGVNQHVWMGLNHLTVVTPGLVNRGQLTVHHVGAFQKTGTVLRTAPGATLTNEGTLTLQSSPNSTPILAGAITNAAGGLITNASDHAGIRPAPLINRGTIRVVTQTLFIAAEVGGPPPDVVMEGGTLSLSNGSYSQTGGDFRHRNGVVTGTGGVTFSGVRFSGFGTWARTLALTGASSLAPGASPGRIAIIGDYTPVSTTVTNIELAGSAPGTGYDQIAVANTARFQGLLSVSLANGFVPRPCQTFEVVTYAARTLMFSNAATPVDVGNGMKLRQVYTATGLVLVAYNAIGPNVYPADVQVSVDGDTDTYDVCMGAGSDVVTVLPDDQVTVDKQTLTFTNQLPQTVTVSALPTATRSTATIRHTASSGTPVATVNVSISGVVPADTDPPVTTALRSQQPNEFGWNRTSVTVDLSASDAVSGVAQVVWSLAGAQTGGATVTGSTASVAIAAEGETTLTYFARDVAGNQEAPRTLTVRIDATSPTVHVTRQPLPNANGWNDTNVTATFNATDERSGIDGEASAEVVFTEEGANQSATRTFRDRAGNEGSATITGVSIDRTPPTLSCSATPNQIWPANNKLIAVSINVTVDGATSFVLESVTSNEPEPNDIMEFVTGTGDTSGQLRAARLGTGTGRVYTFAYRATDPAGNSARTTCEVRVPHDQRRR